MIVRLWWCMPYCTGSEGVGRAIAGELAGHGLHVLLVSRSQAKLDAAAKAISSTNSAVQVRCLQLGASACQRG